jgi:hypothetical protein
MFKYIKLAWRNMWRNWRRTLIATVAIVLSMILLIFMQAKTLWRQCADSRPRIP